MRGTLLTLVAVAILLAAAAAASAAPHRSGFAFGRTGGNIRPFTVTIANSGIVTVRGPAQVGRKQLTPVQLGHLNLTAVKVRFSRLPKARSCAGTLPDVAYTFIRVGDRVARLRGACVPGYTRLWNGLTRAVRFSGG